MCFQHKYILMEAAAGKCLIDLINLLFFFFFNLTAATCPLCWYEEVIRELVNFSFASKHVGYVNLRVSPLSLILRFCSQTLAV